MDNFFADLKITLKFKGIQIRIYPQQALDIIVYDLEKTVDKHENAYNSMFLTVEKFLFSF